ncbi:molybdenum cofactor sulfurase-like [Montipora foliosa]|uniref:molybdenum cofactor sulfurase-like n=1 Tax=Montipora foliosa TaxID=591990 RepID=UPI0035F1B91F
MSDRLSDLEWAFDENDFLTLFGDRYGYLGGIKRIRKQEFSRLEGITYLDHVGATQYPQSIIKSVYDDLTKNLYGNPHSSNPSSVLAKDSVEQVRDRVLCHFNTNAENHSVIFTAGATDALRLLADTFNWQRPVSNGKFHRSCFCYLEANHTSVVGIRGKAESNGAKIVCLSDSDLLDFKQNSPLKTICNAQRSESLDYTKEEYEGDCCCYNLFSYPAMCNFSGTKYPLGWISKVKEELLFSKCSPSCHWFVVLDAASYVSTSPLDLTSCTADFVPVSFYKMFGFPTGLGALIVRNSSSYVLRKTYYGGGTVQATISNEMFSVFRKNLADKFEDGTLPYLEIIALCHAFKAFEKLTGSMLAVLNHTHSLALYTYNEMCAMKHLSGKPLCKIYCKTDFKDETKQGPIINFNLLRTNGTFVGYSEVEKMASLYNIHLRTGCFCNMGACQQFLNLSNEQIRNNLSAGHVCGDDVDLINGEPTGSVRISFGYMSNFDDAKTFLTFLVECFLEVASSDVSVGWTSGTRPGLPSVQGRHFREEETENKTLISASRNMPHKEQHLNNTESGYFYNDNVQESNYGQSNLLSHLPESIKDWHSTDGPITQHMCEEQIKTSTSFCFGLRLEQICLYPIKSCAAFKVEEWEVGVRGFVYDRQWMIVSDSGICLTQKREPQLCLIKPEVDLVNGVLRVRAPGMSSLVVPLCSSSSVNMSMKNDTSLCHTKVCGDKVCAVDCGEEASHWVSDFLKRKCWLIEHCQQDGRTSKLGENEGDNSGIQLSLANESQFLLITKSSINELLINVTQALETKDTETKQKDVDAMISRFRANLTVNGEKPFIEDEWRKIKIGNLVFKNQGKCNRCQMVCVNQETGSRTAEPLKTLGKLRGCRMPFGIHLQHQVNDSGSQPLILRCGDEVIVCE